MGIFPRHVPVGLEHGTVIVVENGEPYEVTTFRTESEYEDFRRPSSVQFVRSLEEDLKRRDFTMNAIAMTEEGEMVDLFAGQEAIQKRNCNSGKCCGSFSRRCPANDAWYSVRKYVRFFFRDENETSN